MTSIPVDNEKRLRSLTAAFIAITSFALVMSLTAIGYFALAASQTAESNSKALRDIHQVNDRLVDCTEPEGACFERGQRQTAEAVGTINEVALLAAACADKDDRQTIKQIRDCITRNLGGGE